MEQLLRSSGYKIGKKYRSRDKKWIYAQRQGAELQIDLLRGNLLEANATGSLGTFDCITAHAFMDLMPLKRAVAIVRKLLKAEGVFYSTLNYDGLTVLLPEYQEPGLERRLLRIYNRSMDQRRSRGRKTGGSLSGRRLFGALLEGGFSILGMGSSDWNVFPSGGVYAKENKLFLYALLSMIEGEARRFRAGPGGAEAADADPIVEPKLLADWYAQRLEAVENGRLSLIVHQLDLLAKPKRA